MRRAGPAAVAGLPGLGVVLALALMPTRLSAQTQTPPPPPPEPAAGTPEEKKIDTIGVPQAEPPPVQPPQPETAPLAPADKPKEPERLTKDAVPDPAYLPGYRTVPSLGMSPFSPQLGALPGGLTPGFSAPMPPNDWTFQFAGFLNMSAQFGLSRRPTPAPGQSDIVVHAPPNTVDEYQSFVGTSTMPGNWIQMNFRYGNRDVTANLTLSTWNPSQPSTYYQLGSQNFLQNAFLTYNVGPFEKLHLRATMGYFFTNYGNLGPYTAGMYQMPYVGMVRGVGGMLLADYPVSPDVSLLIEGGVMGNRNGRSPANIAGANPNSNSDPLFGSSYIGHLHAGLLRKTDITMRAQLHWMINWGQDDRPQYDVDGNPMRDNMVTRGINEAHIPDGRISIYGIDASINHPAWGLLAIGASHVDAHNAWPLRGLTTFGGEGRDLTERWLGVDTQGNGKINVAAINWLASIGKILAWPKPFDSNGPDLTVQAGAVVANTNSVSFCGEDMPHCFDGRIRYKFGAEGLYAFIPYMQAGLRLDHVVPNSKDSNETFDVLAARLVFKTDWQSREAVQLIYARWFYGPGTRPEGSNNVNAPGEIPRLDHQLIAVNVNMWW